MAFALAALCLAGLVSGFLLLRRIPTIPESSPLQDSPPLDMSVIIPARNEAANLPALLTSLLQSHSQPAEVIVVDDDSNDTTGATASSFGATVIQLSAPSPDWRGKSRACHQGALAATSETLLFLDADTRFLPGGLQRTLSYFHSLPPESALSILPFHITQKPYEELSVFFNLVMAIGAGGFSGLDQPRLFGQSLLISRQLYLRAGGHAAVRQHVLENFHFAFHISAANGHLLTASGRGTLLIRMFPHGIAQLCESWEKGFVSGAGATSPIVLFLSIYWLSAATFIFLLLLTGIGIPRPAAIALYLVFTLQIAWLSRKIGSYRLTTALFYPVPLLFYFILFGHAVWLRYTRRPTTWKGRRL
jgi:4,4'-diaponeurosporenoate glycosyltransferase